MSTLDLLTLIAFFTFILLGFAIQTGLQMYQQLPGQRVKKRFKEVLGSTTDRGRQQVIAELQRAQADARRRQRRQNMGTLGYYLNRLDTISAGRGVRFISLAGIITFTGLVAGFWSGFIPASLVTVPAGLIAGPLIAMWFTYSKLQDRFNTKFLIQLPDAIDLIVRASQAGVPAAQSIRTVGDRFEAPLGPEFRRMGDSLLLGSDIEEVLDSAALRISMPDFSFFSVCLLLQRETGGSLADTLENLSSIIRARRDLSLKTRALTAEGRFSGGLLSAMPFMIIGALLATNPEYINVMFEHPTGQTLLWVCAGMLAIGIFLIRKISRLDV